jgi:site-specific recombinase XerD
LFSVVDIVEPGVGVWGYLNLGAIQHPELRRLATSLPRVMSDKWADSTCKAYMSAFLKFKAWADQFDEVSHLSVSPGHICLYLVSLGQSKVSVSVLNAALAGISWAHKMAGFNSPTSNDTVKLTAEGLKRQLSRPRNVASPILPEHLISMIEVSNLSNLSDLRVLAIILIAFAGFMRFSEMAGIRTGHMKIVETHLEIFLPTSKTDQFRQGQTIFISKIGKLTCPVTMLLTYMRVAKIDSESKDFLFKNVQYNKGLCQSTKLQDR